MLTLWLMDCCHGPFSKALWLVAGSFRALAVAFRVSESTCDAQQNESVASSRGAKIPCFPVLSARPLVCITIENLFVRRSTCWPLRRPLLVSPKPTGREC